MRIGIVGAGAIGSVVGGLLTKAGQDVTLLDQWPEHVEAMREHGLRLSGTCGEHVVKVKACHLHEAQAIEEPFDAVFVAVKSYDTEWATALAVRHVRPDGVVVDFQNGINDERVAAIAGRGRTLGCVITIEAGMYEPGHATRTDTGKIGFKIGELDGQDTPRARELARILSDVAPAHVTTNLWGERWSKLAVNCMANEIEPIYGIAAQRFVDAVQGRGLADVERDMAAGARHLSGGRPSLLQDVLRGRRTEIDYLNGHVCRQGRRVGVPTPVNDAVVQAIHDHGVGRLKPDLKNLEPLARVLPRP